MLNTKQTIGAETKRYLLLNKNLQFCLRRNKQTNVTNHRGRIFFRGDLFSVKYLFGKLQLLGSFRYCITHFLYIIFGHFGKHCTHRRTYIGFLRKHGAKARAQRIVISFIPLCYVLSVLCETNCAVSVFLYKAERAKCFCHCINARLSNAYGACKICTAYPARLHIKLSHCQKIFDIRG